MTQNINGSAASEGNSAHTVNYGGTEIPNLINQIKADTEIMAEAFYRIGTNLAELKEEFMCLEPKERRQLGGWKGFCKQELGFSKQHVSNLMRGAVAYENLKSSTVVDVFPISERMIRPLTRYNDDPELQVKLWNEAVEMAGGGLPREQDIIKVVNEQLDREAHEASRKAQEEFRKEYKERTGKDWDPFESFKEKSEQADADKDRKEKARQERQSWRERTYSEDNSRSAGTDAYMAYRALTNLSPDESRIAHRVFKAGFKTMAIQLHPDQGGNHDDMVALNELKEMIEVILGPEPKVEPKQRKEESKAKQTKPDGATPETTATVYPITKAA